MQRRGHGGSPVVLLHGIQGSWRIWTPIIDGLASDHEVFVPTLPGHRGGTPLDGEVSIATLADAVERELDAAGLPTAHLVGNSLGGWLALELARRGRARSVVALSPAGAFTGDRDVKRVVRLLMQGRTPILRHHARLARFLRRPRARRLALRLVMEHGERIPASEVEGLLLDVVECTMFEAFAEWVSGGGVITAGARDCPVRIAWAEHDRTIPFERYGRPMLAALPGAEHVTLPGVGHVPMYDDPELVVRTILEVTRRADQEPIQEKPITMSSSTDVEIDGVRGKVVVRRWDAPSPTRVVVIAHGYGEHSGRYEHVAAKLVASGATVYAPDHVGHGRTAAGADLADFDDIGVMVADVGSVVELARSEHAGLPVALIGHSMGGIIATRYAQGDGQSTLDALVLSGPAIGGNPGFEQLLGMDPIPEIPIDPAALSRDPAVGEAYANDELVYHGPFRRHALQALMDEIDKVKAGPGLGELALLWIHGELDPLAPLDVTRPVVEQIKGPEFEEHVYPGAMHEIFNETNQDEVIGHVVAFLDRVLQRSGTPA